MLCKVLGFQMFIAKMGVISQTTRSAVRRVNIMVRLKTLPEAQLLSLISDLLRLPDLVIQIDYEIVHESPLHLGSELVL